MSHLLAPVAAVEGRIGGKLSRQIELPEKVHTLLQETANNEGSSSSQRKDKKQWISFRPVNVPGKRFVIPFDFAAEQIPKLTLHDRLKERGFKEENWNELKIQFQAVWEQRFSPVGECLLAGSLICIPLVFWASSNADKLGREWIEKFNFYLNPLGMYAKFELIAVLHKTDENKREEFSWLAVAMTPEEVDILKKEASYWMQEYRSDEVLPDSSKVERFNNYYFPEERH